MPERLYDQESLEGCDPAGYPLLGYGNGEEKPPIACTDDVLKCDGKGDINKRRCFSEGYIYDVAILLPLNSKSADAKSYETVSTQTPGYNVKKSSDSQNPVGKVSDTRKFSDLHCDVHDQKKYRNCNSVTRKSFIQRHACVLISVLVVAVFVTVLTVIVGIYIHKDHEIRQRKGEAQQINHSDEIMHEESKHVDCSALTVKLDTDTCPQDSCFSNVDEVILPWRKANNSPVPEHLRKIVVQKDKRHFRTQKTGWYNINTMVTIHSGLRSSALVCITVKPRVHDPICNKVSMATRSVLPVHVSSRIFLRQNDVISIVVKAKDIRIDRNSELEIYGDSC